AIELEEELQRLLDLRLGRAFSERATDQHRRAVAYVGVDPFVGQRFHPHVPESGVDGIGEVEPGIDECAVEVEYQKVDAQAAELFRLRALTALATGLRRGRPLPMPNSCIFRWRVLRWMPRCFAAAH